MTNTSSTDDTGLLLQQATNHITPLLLELGYSLKKEQPHISGERAFVSRDKMVLLGTETSSGRDVVIKCSNSEKIKQEITQEKRVRDRLAELDYEGTNILIPKEIYFGKKNNYLFFITEFIPQDKIYVAHSLKEQFFMILTVFESQETFHLTTYKHVGAIRGICEHFTEKEYCREFSHMLNDIKKTYHDKSLEEVLTATEKFWNNNKNLIDMYGNHLIHTDFVPHNFRIHDRHVYILDYAAMQFGNKYETWARFLNYMTIHNPELEIKLLEYIRSHREKEDYESIRLMRLYKTIFILNYYINEILPRAQGNVREITRVRIAFWTNVLRTILDDKPLLKEIRDEYIKARNALRSEVEKARQREFSKA